MKEKIKVRLLEDKPEFSKYEKKSYDKILNDYKNEIHTVDEYNKIVSLLKHEKNRQDNMKYLINFFLITVPLVLGFIFYNISKEFDTIDYDIMFLVACLGVLGFIMVKGTKIVNSIDNFPVFKDNYIGFGLIILEQNKKLFIEKIQGKTWDEL
jgi:uncharacterized membrane protein